ncbi:hypothetical protein ACCI51_08660 [Microbulbifer echini]|uniref:Transposase n=1 Tax=Microbulbifer echini TaxID=1529067 RepID=A0ABV4NMI1_9GAMM
MKSLFIYFDLQLDAKGYGAQEEQMVDASFISSLKQCNSREENEKIKSGKIPKSIRKNPNVKRHKDLDAHWTKKKTRHIRRQEPRPRRQQALTNSRSGGYLYRGTQLTGVS